MAEVKINIDYLKTVNYALFHANIHVCRSLEVANVSDAPFDDVRVFCRGAYIDDFKSEIISRLNPKESVRFSSFRIEPDSEKLSSLTEITTTTFTITVTSRGKVLMEETHLIEFLPYNYWTGTGIFPQTLASFITPHRKLINDLVVRSAEILKQLTGSSQLTAYQTGNPNEVRQQTAAMFAAVHEAGIIYRAAASNYGVAGQRILLPDEVVASKTADCLELTLLMASILEAMGINSLVVLQSGHAYLGVWLVDDCYNCSVGDDPAFLEKKCSQGINEMLVLETTIATSESASFEEAVHAASLRLALHSVFEMFIDVKRCRLERIFPIPARTEDDHDFEKETEGVSHDEISLELKAPDRYDLSQIMNVRKEFDKFDIWERKLLDFSLRNSLLNLTLRKRAIQFFTFNAPQIEKRLLEGKEFLISPFEASGRTIEPNGKILRSTLHDLYRDYIRNDIDHFNLHTFEPEKNSRIILKYIHRNARNSLEETGANSLFLAVGLLRWYETPFTEKPRYAPLLLIPVSLIYRKRKYYIRSRDEEVIFNITLTEFLRQNFGISLHGLDSLPRQKDNSVDVPLIFAMIREAIKDQRGWDVEEECVLGIFSFSKFLMWNDIHTHRDRLADNVIVESLVKGHLSYDAEEPMPDVREADRNVSPVVTALPVAADSSQLAAVVEGGKGKSFILYGPPGTGKSQTITNIIANALFQGKRVLFVAEKMAALSVVQSRLESIGLDPFCLELHSNKATKRHVLGQLGKALMVDMKRNVVQYDTLGNRLFETRKKLISYIDQLHAVDPEDGLSAYDCIIGYDSIKTNAKIKFRFEDQVDTFLQNEGIKGMEEILAYRVADVLELISNPTRHPLRGFEANRDMLKDLNGLENNLKNDLGRIVRILVKEESINLKEMGPLHDRIVQKYSPKLLEEDPEELRREWDEANSRWFLPRFFAKSKILKRLKKDSPSLDASQMEPLLDDLALYKRGHELIQELQSIMSAYNYGAYKEDEVPERELTEKLGVNLQRWSENVDKLPAWIHWLELCEELKSNGMTCVIEAIEGGNLNPGLIKDAYMRELYKYKLNRKIYKSEALVGFIPLLYNRKVGQYKRQADDFMKLTCKKLFALLANQVPGIFESEAISAELSILRRNISTGGRGISLRELFDQLPTILPRLCPCMLMSPISVAQYLDLSSEKFDLVIFDEASQIPTSESIGAIARGKALIVVGDPKQMPPTTFFSASNVETEDVALDDMESILEDCRTLQMPSLQLQWHYRSRHESLIAFSNNEFYDASLVTFPSVDDSNGRVKLVRVKGCYDRSATRSNLEEAQAVVDEIVRRLKDSELCKESIGVIAFSISQQSLIEDILQEQLEMNKDLQKAADAMYEPIFVKNLETVQGDERDVILFSIGYGPDKTGKVSMNFGPLNNPGGERRLNVAVSRARHEMVVFSSLRASDIDLSRTQARGVIGLKHFLEYAATGRLPLSANSGKVYGSSVIAQKIAENLRERGYDVELNVGRSRFRVDVAVKSKINPDSYLLGILLDGEAYYNTATERDREIVQPSVLENLGWKIMRVWSLDWAQRRGLVVKHIADRLEMLTRQEALSEAKKSHVKASNESLSDVTPQEFSENESEANLLSDDEPETYETQLAEPEVSVVAETQIVEPEEPEVVVTEKSEPEKPVRKKSGESEANRPGRKKKSEAPEIEEAAANVSEVTTAKRRGRKKKTEAPETKETDADVSKESVAKGPGRKKKSEPNENDEIWGRVVRPIRHILRGKDSKLQEYASFSPDPQLVKHYTDRRLIQRIVAIEQPITFGHICKKMQELRPDSKIGATQKKKYASYLTDFYIGENGDIWMNREASLNYSIYRPATGREFSMIPRVEMINGLIDALSDKTVMDEYHLMRWTCKKFDAKCTISAKTILKDILNQLEEQGVLRQVYGEYRIIKKPNPQPSIEPTATPEVDTPATAPEATVPSATQEAVSTENPMEAAVVDNPQAIDPVEASQEDDVTVDAQEA